MVTESRHSQENIPGREMLTALSHSIALSQVLTLNSVFSSAEVGGEMARHTGGLQGSSLIPASTARRRLPPVGVELSPRLTCFTIIPIIPAFPEARGGGGAGPVTAAHSLQRHQSKAFALKSQPGVLPARAKITDYSSVPASSSRRRACWYLRRSARPRCSLSPKAPVSSPAPSHPTNIS